MQNTYPERKFLHLMNFSEETEIVKNILKSPLGLASDVIKSLFEEKLEEREKDLNEKYNKIGIGFNYASYQDLTDSIDNIVQKMILLWTEDSIPVKTPADQAQYIRDLLFLKAYYEKP